LLGSVAMNTTKREDDARVAPVGASSLSVAEYMTAGPYAVGPNEALREAHRLMTTHAIRHLPVTADGRLVGIISDRDVELVWKLSHAPSDVLTVEDAMIADPYTTTPETRLCEAVREMSRRKIGSAVVLDDRRVVGVLTSTDAMLALADVLDGDYVRRTSR
jgi:acetoin utilization protein AcuB